MTRVLDTPIAARLCLIAAMVLAGSSVVFSKTLAQAGPIVLINVLILIPASLLLSVLCWRLEGGFRVSRAAWGPLLLQSLCGIVLFRLFLFYGLPLTSAASAGILTSATPALSAILAWSVLRERVTANSVSGVLLTVLGVLVLTVPGSSSAMGGNPVLGNLLVLGAAFGEAIWNVVSKTSISHSSPLLAASMTTTAALFLFLPLAIHQAMTFDFAGLDAVELATILYYALGATVLAYLCWFAGVRRVTASTAAMFTGWLPVSAIALSAIMLHEPLSWWHALGLGSVLCATMLFASTEPQSQGVHHAH